MRSQIKLMINESDEGVLNVIKGMMNSKYT